MAISRVSSQDVAATGTVSVTATYPAAPTAGNLLVAFIAQTDTSGSSSNGIAGWTYLVNGVASTATSPTSSIHCKIATTNEPSVSATASLGNIGVYLFEYTGDFTKGVSLDTSNSYNPLSASTSAPLTTSSTTVAEELVLAGICWGVAVTSPTFSNSFNTLGINSKFMITDKITATKGVQTTNIAWTTSSENGACMASLRPTIRTLSPHITVGNGMSRSEVAN